MKTLQKSLVAIVGGAVLMSSTVAEVEMPVVFGNDMVLQRDLPVPVWGTGAPGEEVTVSFADQSVSAKADDNGKWMVKLEPLTTSATGRTMTVKGSNTITFQRVLVGEVWLCSGQSNMAGRFVAAKGRAIDPAVFKTDTSRFRFLPPNGGWCALSDKTQNKLSCVAFYFGIELYRKLDAPIGLIQRYNSGTPIQAWMPTDAAEAIREKLGIPEDWNDDKGNRRPGVQFDGKIDPIIPVAMRGTIWYQGERNAKTGTGWEYDRLLAFHIETWRRLWAARAGLPLREFPFYYVQVPTQAATGEWPWLRDRMRRALDLAENTGMAVFYDYGPSLHPTDKQPAGERLALWALAKDYGHEDLVHCGPLLNDVKIERARAVLTFKHIGGGLRSKSGGQELEFFEIAGKDGEYVPAEARINGETVVVHSPAVPTPVYVRYLFRKAEADAEVSLINAEGLPASPFMTDDIRPSRDAEGKEN